MSAKDGPKLGIIPDASASGEKRKSGFVKLGHVLAGFLVIAFVGIYALRSYQYDNWVRYFFKDTVNLGATCQYAAVGDESETYPEALDRAPLNAVRLPHDQTVIVQAAPDRAHYHARYLCELAASDVSLKTGVPYIHVGWVFADDTRILINGVERLHFTGTEKPVIPVSVGDLESGRLVFEVKLSSKRGSRIGISGLAPLVVADSTKKNFRIFGVETALQNVTVLYAVLPLLTLAMVLVLGWYYGVRSRLIVATFFYFCLSLTANLFKMGAELLPWDFSLSSFLSRPFSSSAWLAFILFGMELLRWKNRNLTKMIGGVALLTALQVAVIPFIEDKNGFVYKCLQAHWILAIAGGSAVFAAALRKAKRPETGSDMQRIDVAFAVLAAIFTLMIAADATVNILDLGVIVRYYVDLFLPLFVGGMLLYSLALIEKHYQAERTARLKIEHDLTLAHEIQDSLAPPPSYLHADRLQINTYQIKHSAVAGDWVGFRELATGEIVVVVADATGKGVQAALIVHAVQSLWADALRDETFDPIHWLTRVNRTLFTLGQRKPHSMTIGVAVITCRATSYFGAGHVPLFIVDQEKNKITPLMAKGGVLGIKEQVSITEVRHEYATEDNLILLLGTDGVFDKGSRTNKREVLAMIENLGAKGQGALEDVDVDDDKTLIVVKTNAKAAVTAA